MILDKIDIGVLVNILGIGAFIAAFCLGIVLLFKTDEGRKLKAYIKQLQKSLDELDEQAKLIVKTDLELNKTQEELDKKISGLYTLQRLSRAISTTLDENQIFTRIEESLVKELGFEKAFALAFDNTKEGLPNLILKMHAGYDEDEAERFCQKLKEKNIMAALIKHGSLFSSLLPEGTNNYKRAEFKQAIEEIKTICGLSSFSGSLISTKDGYYGLIIMGNESALSVLTEGDEEMLGILATQLGQTIENAKLFEETFRSHQELERRVKERTQELSSALSAIQQISKRKSEFVSAVSHELRTPLTSIKGYASILAGGQLGELPKPAKERIEKINRHSNELTELINNLLDISRIESGRVELKIEPQDIRQIIEGISDIFMPHFKEKNIAFSSDIPEKLPGVLADANQIRRVFINLVGNAIKYTPAGGKISISARKDNGSISVSVSDSGCGIPEEDLEKIFDEFYRVSSQDNQTIKGTGLGLSLVKYIVEAHKGKIWASSKAGAGSTFTFSLPAA
ncbi:MAG: hypothetical protein COV72_05660 [Candidatus Omnitrophica bacterium CG11_big_fil_rev_8_21_14_0_20_42_13]|uniref:histidine kinase n=1 Tax=Candidatus Ghiorseimicrobium undicola TaxID=1974746 RepID=A0A2H0LWY1_9BACT|nr:MAG: hypothetical protein COV72_05660 [Candidatus Omnitrophica bacterium CG11_big_fil_rev_8_21_14_0_20_42_13]